MAGTLGQCDYMHVSKRYVYMDMEKVKMAILSYCTVEVEVKVDAADLPAQIDMSRGSDGLRPAQAVAFLLQMMRSAN